MEVTYKITDCLRIPHTEDLTILVLDRDYEFHGCRKSIAIIDGEEFEYTLNSISKWMVIHTKKDFKGKTVAVSYSTD